MLPVGNHQGCEASVQEPPGRCPGVRQHGFRECMVAMMTGGRGLFHGWHVGEACTVSNWWCVGAEYQQCAAVYGGPSARGVVCSCYKHTTYDSANLLQ